MLDPTTNGKPGAAHAKTIAAERQHMAQAGDVWGLWAQWTRSDDTRSNFQEIGDLLRQAIEVRVRTAPTRFRREILSEMIGFTGYLVLRAQFRARLLIEQEDEDMRRRGGWDSSLRMDELMPKLLELQRHFGELAQLSARTERLTELAQQRRVSNDGVKGQQRKRRKKG